MRSPISDIPRPNLATIQRGTMAYSWRGVLLNKNPFDFALYPLVLWRLQPRTIIEVGSKEGGSALWFWDTCRAFGLETKIISVDIDQRAKFEHPGITFLSGDGKQLSKTLTPRLMEKIERPVFIVEDTDHHFLTVLGVLRFAERHLLPGEYIAVEDGICDSFGHEDRFGGGPNRAVKQFLATRPDFEIDTGLCDFFGTNVTWNTNGWLRRMPADPIVWRAEGAPRGT